MIVCLLCLFVGTAAAQEIDADQFDADVKAFNECLRSGKAEACPKPEPKPVVAQEDQAPAEEVDDGCWEPWGGFEICPATDRRDVDCRLTATDQVPNVDFCARDSQDRQDLEATNAADTERADDTGDVERPDSSDRPDPPDRPERPQPPETSAHPMQSGD